jgi:anti-sigma factor RsiW
VKGKLTQQDLTDYALNELSPNERLYVESLLAVSEEYRNDIYEMIDAALMLEEGFEIEEEKMPALLTDGQRQRVLEVELPNRFFQRAAVLLSAAAAIALALFNHDILLPKGATSMGQVATLEGAISDEDDLATKLANFRQLAEDPGFKKWFSAQPVNSQGYSAATQSSWGFAPRVSFDFK